MVLRIGIGYEQEEPGLFIYDDETGRIVLSSDVPNEELLKKIRNSAVQFVEAEAGPT